MKNNRGQYKLLVTSDVAINATASDVEIDITTELTSMLSTDGWAGRPLALTNSGAENIAGVCTDVPYNFVELLDANSHALVFDGPLKIYGKLTYSASVYTVSFFTFDGSTELPYDFTVDTDVELFIKYRFPIDQLPTDRQVLYNVTNRINPPLAENISFNAGASGMLSTEVNSAIIEAYLLAAAGGSIMTYNAPLYQPTPTSLSIKIANAVDTGALAASDFVVFDAKPTGATNVGSAGAGVFKAMNSKILEFKKIVQGSGVTIVEDVDSITISAPTGSDANYLHIQNISSTSWTVNHGLNKYPAVTVMTFDGSDWVEVVAEVKFVSLNQLIVQVTPATTGQVACN